MHEGDHSASALAEFVHGQFRALVLEPRFPCVGGRSAVRRGTYRFALYAELDTGATTATLLGDLQTFVAERETQGSELTTLVACFLGPHPRNEAHFRAMVRSQLQRLRAADPAPWDPTVSADPADPHYAYSVAGRAFTIVPLSAASPRWARRFAWPTVIFNAEAVFHQLRDDGGLGRFRETVRARDVALQGDVNPEVKPT
jgi:FPC/CPF motif-containing protein YcgG